MPSFHFQKKTNNEVVIGMWCLLVTLLGAPADLSCMILKMQWHNSCLKPGKIRSATSYNIILINPNSLTQETNMSSPKPQRTMGPWLLALSSLSPQTSQSDGRSAAPSAVATGSCSYRFWWLSQGANRPNVPCPVKGPTRLPRREANFRDVLHCILRLEMSQCSENKMITLCAIVCFFPAKTCHLFSEVSRVS